MHRIIFPCLLLITCQRQSESSRTSDNVRTSDSVDSHDMELSEDSAAASDPSATTSTIIDKATDYDPVICCKYFENGNKLYDYMSKAECEKGKKGERILKGACDAAPETDPTLPPPPPSKVIFATTCEVGPVPSYLTIDEISCSKASDKPREACNSNSANSANSATATVRGSLTTCLEHINAICKSDGGHLLYGKSENTLSTYPPLQWTSPTTQENRYICEVIDIVPQHGPDPEKGGTFDSPPSADDKVYTHCYVTVYATATVQCKRL